MVPEGGGCVSIWGGINTPLSCCPSFPTFIPWIQLSPPASSFFHLSGIQTHPRPFVFRGEGTDTFGCPASPRYCGGSLTGVAQPKCDSSQRILELEGGRCQDPVWPLCPAALTHVGPCQEQEWGWRSPAFPFSISPCSSWGGRGPRGS